MGSPDSPICCACPVATPSLFFGFSGCAVGQESVWQCRRYKRHGFNPWVEKIPGEGHGNQLQYSCLENPHGQRSLVGYNSIRSQRDRYDWSSLACTLIWLVLCLLSESRLYSLDSHLLNINTLMAPKAGGSQNGWSPAPPSRISIGYVGKGCLPPSLTFLPPQCWGSPTAEQGILPGCTWDMWMLRSGKQLGVFQSDILQIFSLHYLEEQLSTRKGRCTFPSSVVSVISGTSALYLH